MTKIRNPTNTSKINSAQSTEGSKKAEDALSLDQVAPRDDKGANFLGGSREDYEILSLPAVETQQSMNLSESFEERALEIDALAFEFEGMGIGEELEQSAERYRVGVKMVNAGVPGAIARDFVDDSERRITQIAAVAGQAASFEAGTWKPDFDFERAKKLVPGFESMLKGVEAIGDAADKFAKLQELIGNPVLGLPEVVQDIVFDPEKFVKDLPVGATVKFAIKGGGNVDGVSLGGGMSIGIKKTATGFTVTGKQEAAAGIGAASDSGGVNVTVPYSRSYSIDAKNIDELGIALAKVAGLAGYPAAAGDLANLAFDDELQVETKGGIQVAGSIADTLGASLQFSVYSKEVLVDGKEHEIIGAEYSPSVSFSLASKLGNMELGLGPNKFATNAFAASAKAYSEIDATTGGVTAGLDLKLIVSGKEANVAVKIMRKDGQPMTHKEFAALLEGEATLESLGLVARATLSANNVFDASLGTEAEVKEGSKAPTNKLMSAGVSVSVTKPILKKPVVVDFSLAAIREKLGV